MVIETQLLTFHQWVMETFVVFFERLAVLGLLGLALGYLIAAFRYGPLMGGDVTYKVVRTGFLELFQMRPRRILAMAWLAVQESIRRRILVAFGIFLVILLFAGWFLDPGTHDPSTLYLSFVLTTTTYLVLLLALFLSSFSLPADIKNHTIYTIVTKPVRSGEIVLGRILGFTAIGTMLLATMGLFSYFFVVRVLNHTHEVEVESLNPIKGDDTGAQKGRTSLAQNHRHEVTIDPDGTGTTSVKQHHWHEITPTDDKKGYVVGPPQGMFQARVPIYGELKFRDRAGKPDKKGVNVGNEWTYRSYIEGGTLAAAVWTFDKLEREKFPDGMHLEMTVRVFRTYKGNINKGILGSVVIKNPRTGRASQIDTFEAKDNEIDERFVPLKLKDSTGKDLDLFDDLVDDGKLEVWLQCLDPTQYFGAAQPDLYLRASDGSFALNFFKGFVGIWLQMVLVTAFGVMFSTFLNGAVAMEATMGVVVLGYCTDFVSKVAAGKIQGGGPIESVIRIFRQQNVVTEMDQGLTRDVVQTVDKIFMKVMDAVVHLIPDFKQFINVDYVAHGFDVPLDTILIQIFSTMGYLAVVFVVGYVFLKTREVAR